LSCSAAKKNSRGKIIGGQITPGKTGSVKLLNVQLNLQQEFPSRHFSFPALQ